MAGQPERIPSVPFRTTTQISASGYRFRMATTVGVISNASPMCFNFTNRIFGAFSATGSKSGEIIRRVKGFESVVRKMHRLAPA